MGGVYFNENDPAAAHVLRELMREGFLPEGVVDGRSIREVRADDLRGFAQCHFFAGFGGWSLAARAAGWPDDRPLWTGSCPCQPFSQAGRRKGREDRRHLWPDFHRLIASARPAVVVGEQVAGKDGLDWFDGVAADLGSEDYACRAVDIPAAAVDAPHVRQRLYWVAVADGDGAVGRIGDEQPAGQQSNNEQNARNRVWAGSRHVAVADADGGGCPGRAQDAQRGAIGRDAAQWANGGALGDAERARLEGQRGHGDGAPGRAVAAGSTAAPDGRRNRSFWSDAEWIVCHDDKARRAEPGIRLLAHGVVGRVDAWRLAGNGLVLPLAAEVLAALMDVAPAPTIGEAA